MRERLKFLGFRGVSFMGWGEVWDLKEIVRV
jgi:hypothetical protein